MPNVKSFRPTERQEAALRRIRRKHGLANDTEVIRFVIQKGIEAEGEDEDGLERLFSFMAPEEYRLKGRSMTSEEVDEVAYGDHIWPGTDA